MRKDELKKSTILRTIIPNDLLNDIQHHIEQHGCTISELLRNGVKLQIGKKPVIIQRPPHKPTETKAPQAQLVCCNVWQTITELPYYCRYCHRKYLQATQPQVEGEAIRESHYININKQRNLLFLYKAGVLDCIPLQKGSHNPFENQQLERVRIVSLTKRIRPPKDYFPIKTIQRNNTMKYYIFQVLCDDCHQWLSTLSFEKIRDGIGLRHSCNPCRKKREQKTKPHASYALSPEEEDYYVSRMQELSA